MNTLHFSIRINAPKEKVWRVMLEHETYSRWTAAFAEGSYYDGSWGEGEAIRFLTPGGAGMSAVIAENRLLEFISIQHLGMIKGGIEDIKSPGNTPWAPVFENYRFSEKNSSTELIIDVDVMTEWEDFMAKSWPAALQSLKEICEEVE
jgi:hypothetical protein